MSETTKILNEEHQNILKVIEALSNECDSLEAGKEINSSFFERAIKFIRNYADKVHHAKEEDILFIKLCSDDVHMHCNPTEQMLYEHKLGREFVAGMDQSVKDQDKDKLIENSRGYINLLREHIYKEDNILFPMADEALDDETKSKMLVDFQKADERLKKEREENLAFVKEIESN